MLFYNWREMVAWVAIFVVALAIILVGVENGGDTGTLRLAVGSKDSIQLQAGEALKRLIERRTSLQVALVQGEDSSSLQRLLLDRKADVALIAPAALSDGQQWVGIAPVGSLFAHVLVDSKLTASSIFDLKGAVINVGSQSGDSYSLGLSILQDLGLASRKEMSMKDDPRANTGVANIITDHFASPLWSPLLENGRYRLMGLREAAAVAARDPLWVPAKIPAFVYSSAAGQWPATELGTIATPLVMAGLPDASKSLMAELASALNSSEGRALRERFNQSATEVAWQWLPKHSAVGGDALPIKELLRDEIAWWVEHKLLVGLVLLGGLLVAWQSRNVKISRALTQSRQVTDEIETMMSQLLGIESRVRAETDLRVLYQFLDDVEQMKMRGSKRILSSAMLVQDPLLFTFQQQCNHVTGILEKRLHGKPVLASVA